jgi:hypothetical protein
MPVTDTTPEPHMEWSKITELLTIQFPVAALNLAAVYFAFRFVDRRDARLDERADRVRKEIREESEREILRLREAQKEHLASRDKEVARLTEELARKIDRLTKKVDDLAPGKG